MSNFNVVIIDDEPLAIEVLKSHLQKFDSFFVIETFTNAIKANEFLNQNKVDLLFLDIEMPGINGIDFYKTLNTPPKTIFTTAYRNYAVDAFDLDVIDYLLKPISFERFFKAINRFLKNPEKSTSNESVNNHCIINIKADKKTYKIDCSTILYIEGMDDYIKIHTSNSVIIGYYRMQQIIEELPKNFVRIHRSYIVNTDYISAYSNAFVELDELKLPIGKTYRGIDLE